MLVPLGWDDGLPKKLGGSKLENLSPTTRARVLLATRDLCYRLGGCYRDEAGQNWCLEDVLEELSNLPHVPDKLEARQQRQQRPHRKSKRRKKQQRQRHRYRCFHR